MAGQRPLRLSDLCLAGQGDSYPPVIAVCHGTTLTHPSQAAGWTGATRRSGHEWTLGSFATSDLTRTQRPPGRLRQGGAAERL
jgi:hypothetical protein